MLKINDLNPSCEPPHWVKIFHDKPWQIGNFHRSTWLLRSEISSFKFQNLWLCQWAAESGHFGHFGRFPSTNRIPTNIPHPRVWTRATSLHNFATFHGHQIPPRNDYGSIPAFSSDWYSSGIPSTKTVEALHKKHIPNPKGANSVKVVDIYLWKGGFSKKKETETLEWCYLQYYTFGITCLRAKCISCQSIKMLTLG